MSAPNVTGAAHLTVGHGTSWTPGPWEARNGSLHRQHWLIDAPGRRFIATIDGPPDAEGEANGRLVAAAPDHALICWAMCVQDGRWEEWVPFDGKGEFCFAGLKYATSLDEFGCPKLTPALRAAITQSQRLPA